MTEQYPQGEIHPEQAEAEAIKAFARINAQEQDYLEKPISTHYNKAREHLNKLTEYLPEDSRTSFIETVNKKEAIFLRIGREATKVFSLARSSSVSELEREQGQLLEFLSSLDDQEITSPTVELKEEIENKLVNLFVNYLERIRKVCVSSGVFRGKEADLDVLIDAENEFTPILSIPQEYHALIQEILN